MLKLWFELFGDAIGAFYEIFDQTSDSVWQKCSHSNSGKPVISAKTGIDLGKTFLLKEGMELNKDIVQSTKGGKVC